MDNNVDCEQRQLYFSPVLSLCLFFLLYSNGEDPITVLNRIDLSWYPSLVDDLWGSFIQSFTIEYDVSCSFLLGEEIHFSVFVMSRYWILSNVFFCIYWDDHIIFSLFCKCGKLHWFSDVKATLHSPNNSINIPIKFIFKKKNTNGLKWFLKRLWWSPIPLRIISSTLYFLFCPHPPHSSSTGLL